MSSADPPAVARRRVRIAIRNARDAKQLTQTQVAEAMDWSLSKVMRIEKGEVNISSGDLRMLLDHLSITDPVEVEQLLEAARIARNERRSADPRFKEHLPAGLFQLMQYEREARVVRYFTMALVPGFLQTPEYAAAIYQMHPADLDPTTIRIRLEARLERRRRLLDGADRPQYLAIFDESVLYREIGGPEVMAAQLWELLRLMRGAPLQIRILPFAAAGPVALFGPFSVVDMGDDDDPILYREGPTDDAIVRSSKEIAVHRAWFERLWELAYDDAESAALITERAEATALATRRKRPPG